MANVLGSSGIPLVLTEGRPTRRWVGVGLGHTLYASFNWFCDHVFYVYVVYKLGVWIGGGVMTAFSLIQCALTLLVYERMKIDWVGTGLLTKWRKPASPSSPRPSPIGDLKRADCLAFFLLSFFQDPFITTAYFRRGRFDGLSLRDWRIFLGSVVASNVYWTARAGFLAAAISALRLALSR